MCHSIERSSSRGRFRRCRVQQQSGLGRAASARECARGFGLRHHIREPAGVAASASATIMAHSNAFDSASAILTVVPANISGIGCSNPTSITGGSSFHCNVYFDGTPPAGCSIDSYRKQQSLRGSFWFRYLQPLQQQRGTSDLSRPGRCASHLLGKLSRQGCNDQRQHLSARHNLDIAQSHISERWQ